MAQATGTNSGGDGLTTIRILGFSGKESDWNRWSKTFLAMAKVKGYKNELKADGAAPADPDKNEQAYNALMLSCQDDVTFGLVDEAGGDARLAWKLLETKFEPDTGMRKVELKREFQKRTLAQGEDPEVWINELELIRRRLKNLKIDISDEDFILNVLNGATEEYELVVQLCEEDLSVGQGNALTTQKVRERFRQRYQRLEANEKNGDGGEAALFVGQFKGLCKVCGKPGHKGADCFTLEKNKDKKKAFYENKDKRKKKGKGKKNVKCYKCGEKGHYADQCKSETKKPKDSENESGGEEADIVLMSEDNKQVQMREPNLWVADTGATRHMVNSPDGLFNVRRVSEDDKVIAANGQSMGTLMVGDWQGWSINPKGERKELIIKDVAYVPGLRSNLFSLTKMMKEGWKLTNDGKDSIAIQKKKEKFVFDKVVKSPNGFLVGKLLHPQVKKKEGQVGMVALDAKLVHNQLGHPGQEIFKATVEKLGLKIKNNEEIECESCFFRKAQQKNVKKD